MVHTAKNKIKALFDFAGKSKEQTKEIVTFLLVRDRFCCLDSVREIPATIPKLNQVFWLTVSDLSISIYLCPNH